MIPPKPAIMGLRRELMGGLALGRLWSLFFDAGSWAGWYRRRGHHFAGNALLPLAIPWNRTRPSMLLTKNDRMRLPRNEVLCFQFLMQCFGDLQPLSKEGASRCFPSHRTSVCPCQ